MQPAIEPHVITTSTLSFNFPSTISNEIFRDNVINTLKGLLDNNFDLVFVDGQDEIGKTTFLAQFAKKHPNNSISCFFKPINTFSSSQDIIIGDLCRQLNFLLTGDIDLPSELIFNVETLAQYFRSFQRKPNRKDLYIVLDGFEHVEKRNLYQIKELFEVLPIGLPRFKFLLSENQKKVLNTILSELNTKKLKHTVYPYSSFGLDESIKYFSGLNLSREHIIDIQKLTQSLPGRLKYIHDILNSGKTFEEFTNKYESYADLLEDQWNEIDNEDETLRMFLALVAFEDYSYNAENVTKILNIEMSDVIKYIASTTFVDVHPENGSITFRSVTFRNFIIEKLKAYRLKIEEAIISYLLEDTMTIESIMELPKRLERTNKFDKLLEVLSEAKFEQIIEKKQSLTFLEEQTEIGIRAASALSKHPELFKLSLQKACISEIKNTYVRESEIEVKLELKEFDSAYDLAQQSLLKEDRFKLLVFLAKKKKEKGLSVESEILETIKALYLQIDPKSFQDQDEAIDICSNLIYSFPELAIDFLEKVTGSNTSTIGDLGLIRLAMLMQKLKGKIDDSDVIDNINSKIKDPKIKNLAGGYTFLVGDKTPDEFIRKMTEISNEGERLQVIRIYLTENKTNKNVFIVLDFALNTILKASSDYPTNASILYEISSPLPFMQNQKEILDVLDRFESFISISKEKGPTISHIKFLLNLATAELRIDFGKARNRFYEIYGIIDGLSDLGLKCHALAIFFSQIKLFDKESKLENEDQFETDSFNSLNLMYDNLLLETAQHYKMTQPIIEEIGKVAPDVAILFAQKINTKNRRDNAFVAGLQSYLENEGSNLNLITINKFYQHISDPKVKDNAWLLVIERFEELKNDVFVNSPDFKNYLSRVTDSYSNLYKCYAFSSLISIVNFSANKSILLEELYNHIKCFWENLDDTNQKIEFGFILATKLVAVNKTWAKEFHDKAEEEKKVATFETPNSHDLYFNCLMLSIKSFSGLLKIDSYKEEHLEGLINYIINSPSKISQIRLLSNLLIRIYDANNLVLFRKIFDTHVKQFVYALSNDHIAFSKSEKTEAIADISIISFLFSPDLYFELAAKLPISFVDFSYGNVCQYLLTKSIPHEPYEQSEKELKISYENGLSILTLLEKMSMDSLIYERIKQLTICAENHSFTKEQLNSIAARLKEIIRNKLPDSKNIRHDGYKIVSLAHVYKLEGNRLENDWANIIAQAKAVSNIADRSYVLSILASLLPANMKTSTKAVLLEESIKTAEKITSYIARVEQYTELVKSYKKINLNGCKETMRTAVKESVFENNTELFQSQKAMIDFAHEIDSDFAEELLKIIDTDPARKQISNNLKRHVKELNSTKTFIAKSSIEYEQTEIKELSNICLSYETKLNSKRIAAKPIEQTSQWLMYSHKLPISETMSIYSAFIQNANVRYKDGEKTALSILTSLFELSIRNIQMIKILAAKTKNKNITNIDTPIKPSSSHLVVGPGDREVALEFIRNWIKNEVVEHIKICDPYFTSNDLELIKEIIMIKPDLKKIYVLAGNENQDYQNLSEIYIQRWGEICDQDPPETSIIIVGTKGKTENVISPNHDRWLITFNSGLRMGTSFNSLGITKNSELSIMPPIEAKEVEIDIIDKYIYRSEKYHNEQRLYYTEISL